MLQDLVYSDFWITNLILSTFCSSALLQYTSEKSVWAEFSLNFEISSILPAAHRWLGSEKVGNKQNLFLRVVGLP